MIRAIVTAPPYAPFLDEVAAHPLVCGLRLNTVMPLREGPGEALDRLRALGQPLWVDLKGRQLRVVGAAIPPYTEVHLSHPVHVRTPVDAFFSDGRECVRVAAADGERIILADGPRRLIGPGESVNIVHPSLEIEGTLTETDRAYLTAMGELGLNRVLISYVESPSDVEEVRRLLPDAEVLLKIETQRGLDYARRHGASQGRLVAGRGDLYVEVLRPHRIVGALRDNNLAVLRNHGLVTVGATLAEAIQRAVFFELACGVIVRGGSAVQPLSEEAIAELRHLAREGGYGQKN